MSFSSNVVDYRIAPRKSDSEIPEGLKRMVAIQTKSGCSRTSIDILGLHHEWPHGIRHCRLVVHPSRVFWLPFKRENTLVSYTTVEQGCWAKVVNMLSKAACCTRNELKSMKLGLLSAFVWHIFRVEYANCTNHIWTRRMKASYSFCHMTYTYQAPGLEFKGRCCFMNDLQDVGWWQSWSKASEGELRWQFANLTDVVWWW